MSVAGPQRKTEKQVAFGSLTGFLAFGFGSGLSAKAPGTVGTLAAVPLALLLTVLPLSLYLVLLVVMFAVGVPICSRAAEALGSKDPGGIVWDEIVAFCLCLAFVPLAWGWWLAAFVAFRFFDILKPWPVRWAERRFKGGLGIMVDDVVAAIYAITLLLAAQWLIRTLT